MPIRSLAACCLLVAAIAAPAAETPLPFPHEQVDLPHDGSVRWGRLANGLGYAVMANAEPKGKMSLRLLIDAGSLDEEERERGIAHYLEHMAFNGSEHFAAGDLVTKLQAKGVRFGSHTNAHTSFDETVYKLDFPDTEPESVDLALRVMADWAGALLIEPDEVERERGIIMAEMRDRDGWQIRTWRHLYRELFPGLRIGERFPIGVPETVQAFTADDLRAFYERWYQPENAFLAVVGDFDPAVVQARIEEIFASWDPDAELPGERPFAPLQAAELAVVFHHEDEAGGTYVLLDQVEERPTPPDGVGRRREAVVRALGAAIVSRRLSEIAESGPDAPILSGGGGVGDAFDAFESGSVQVTARPGRVLDAVRVVERETRRFALHGPTERELRVAVANQLAALQEAVDRAATRTSASLASTLYAHVKAGLVVMSPAQQLEFQRPILESVDAEQVRTSWSDGFSGGHRMVAVFGKEDLGPDAEQGIRDAWIAAAAEELEQVDAREGAEWAYGARPEPAAIASDEILAHGIRRLVLANNAVCHLLPRDAKPNEVAISLRLHLPPVPHRPGLREFAARSFMAAGLGRHEAKELRDVLAGTKASVGGPSFEDDGIVFTAATTPDEIELALQQLRAWIVDPGWRAEAFERARAAWTQSLAAVPRDLEAMHDRHWSLLVTGGAPQRRSATLAEAAVLTAEDVRAWLAPLLATASVECAVVGDFDMEAVAPLVASYIGSLGEREPLPITPELASAGAMAPAAELPHAELRLVVPATVRRAVLRWSFPTDDMGDIARTRRLGMLSAVVGEELRKRIREELGEAYSPGAWHSASDVYDGVGMLSLQVGVDAGREDATLEVLREIVADIRAQGISDEQLAQVKTPQLANLGSYRETNGYWLNSVASRATSHPERLAWAEGMEADYASITAAELSALARQYLDPARALLVVAVSPGQQAAEPAPADGAAAEPDVP